MYIACFTTSPQRASGLRPGPVDILRMAAAVSVHPSPHAIGIMAGRRAPLSNIPNAANSPFRAPQPSMKRSRSQSNAGSENTQGQPPPAKRKVIEVNESNPPTPRRKHGQALLDQVAQRAERAAAARTTRHQKPDESIETLRQWQNFYRKAFPGFVFYFDNVHDDSRRYFHKSFQTLGAVSYTPYQCCDSR